MIDTSFKETCLTCLSTLLKSSMSWIFLSWRIWPNFSLSAFAESSSEDNEILLESIAPPLTSRYTRAYVAGISDKRPPMSATGKYIITGSYIRTDGGKFFGRGGRGLSSSSLE